jgi:hypothetical protein
MSSESDSLSSSDGSSNTSMKFSINESESEGINR